MWASVGKEKEIYCSQTLGHTEFSNSPILLTLVSTAQPKSKTSVTIASGAAGSMSGLLINAEFIN